jgi:pyruvate,water dikinase
MTPNFIVTFEQTTALEIVGGKGLNLIRLTGAKMPVPPGFVVSTAAYEAFVKFNRFDEQLSATFAMLEQGQPLAEISAQIRKAFENGEFPPELAGQITDAYRELGKISGKSDLSVAVRSSATAEDLAEASFAGQQDTYLNVRGEKDLLGAIRRCFGSLWSERAIDYRSRQRLAPLSAQLAVVVQQMVFAEAAGVAFTADPISGDSNQMVVEAVYGLGESLVSGLITPDHIVLDKRSGTILSYSTAEKTEMIVSTGNGTKEQPVPRLKRRARVLGVQQVQALYHLGQIIEAVYGHSQDLEWCLTDGSLYIVQARPITTLPARPVTWDAPGPGQWLHGGGTFEMITEPISPLFETFLLPIFVNAIIKMVDEAGLKSALPGVPYRVVNGHIYLHMDLHLRPWHLAGVLKDFSMHLNSMDAQVSEQTLYRETVARLRQPALSELTSEQILARMQALGEAGMRYWLQIMKLVQVIYRQEKAFTDFYNRRVRRPGDSEPEIFLRGQKIMSWEAECSTFGLAQLAQKHAPVLDVLRSTPETALETLIGLPGGSEFLSTLEVHLDRYGHQLSSFDLSLPTLADDPRPVLTAIQAFLNGKESPCTRQERMNAEREQAIALALSRLSTRNGQKFTRLLETAQHASRTREDALFDVGLAWTQMHRCALELGRRLAQTGVIAQAGDVFWLTFDEIRAALSVSDPLTAKVAERQANNQIWSTVNAPYLLPMSSKPAFWWSWVFPTPELQRHPDAHTLTGLGVSPGKVTAVARVIHSLDEMEQLNPGEILVARTTTPAWTPLFARAAGLITDLGGPLAHGSIVAREVGIPAVMGTGNATHKIHSGQVVTVLGSEGKVVLA